MLKMWGKPSHPNSCGFPVNNDHFLMQLVMAIPVTGSFPLVGGQDLASASSRGGRQDPLVWAAGCGRLDCVQALVEGQGSGLDAKERGYQPLHAAASVGSVAVCEYLLTTANAKVHFPYQPTDPIPRDYDPWSCVG